MRWHTFLAALGLLLAPFAAPPAHATNTVLLACGEDSCLQKSVGGNTGLAVTTTTTWRRTAWSREALMVAVVANTADPPAYRWIGPTFTATGGDLWVHAQAWVASGGLTTANVQGLIVRSPDGVARILIRTTATPGTLKVSTRNAAGTFADLATASSGLTFSTANAIDLHINYTCSGAGGVDLWVNGVRVVNYTGNPCTDAATTLNQVEVAELVAPSNPDCTTGNGGTCWSEIVVANYSTLGMNLLSLTGTGAGNTQSFAPNTLGNINKTVNDDSTAVSATSSGVLSEWTQGTAIPAGNWNVQAVSQDIRAQAGSSSPTTLLPAIRTHSTDYTTGSSPSSIAPLTSYSNFNVIWMTNPNTGAAFTTSEITAPLQWGWQSNP